MSNAKSRRAHLYRSLFLQLHGRVPCWICGLHMEPHEATLEHITPHAKGGTLRYDNVVLTHSHCNNMRHNAGPARVDAPVVPPIARPCVTVRVTGDAASQLVAPPRKDS